MANTFHRVHQSLRADSGFRSMTLLLSGVALLAGWIVWAFRAHVTRYEISDSARLEVAGAAYPVQASVSGRLVSFRMLLGKDVHAGETLAEVEDDAEQLSLRQEATRLATLKPQFDALQAQMQSENDGRTDERRVLDFSLEQARAQYQQAEAQAALAAREAERATRLRAEGVSSEADTQRAKTDAESKQAAAENLKAAISRLQPELQVRDSDRDVRLKQILADTAKVEGDMAASSGNIKRLQYDIERRRIRAPVSGRLGECAALRPGSHISEGQQLGIILPSGKLEVIAQFQPSAALGKVHPGQLAIMRLEGFPWAQYGTISARVSQVASEIRDGKVRVELAVNSISRPGLPIQHGLPGSVEVQIERVSPAQLVLRSAGDLLGAR